MKHKWKLSLVHSLVIISSSAFYSQGISVDSLYLGQTPLGTTPKIFSLPVSNGFFAVERIAIYNDSKEIYYNELNGWDNSSQYRIKYFNYSGNYFQTGKISF